MKKTLYMMRHGQTLFNLRRKIQGDCDSPLTELGIKQALKAGEYLADVEFDKYYCSTSERASDTLELVAGSDVPYTRLKALKEMSFGIFEGESEDLNPSTEEGYDHIFPKYGGESRNDVKERLKETLLNVMAKEDHDTVLAVSHGGASYHFFKNWTTPKQHVEIFENGGFSNCCILKYEYYDNKFEFIEIIRPTVEETI